MGFDINEDKEYIEIYGAREHNLKNIDCTIPRNSLVVITGLSGSGKSSLAFDTIYAEGQRRYMESFSAYARNFLGNMERPDVDKITGLSPVIAIEQKTTNTNPRSTVGTVTEIYDFMRLLFARAGEAFSFITGEKMIRLSDEQIIKLMMKDYEGKPTVLKSEITKDIPDNTGANNILTSLLGAKFNIVDIEKKPGKKSPSAPFTTSTLQQEASRKLGFSVAKTMMVAQGL